MAAAKTLGRLLSGDSDAAFRFDDLCSLLESPGFDKRVKGSHHLFRKAGVEESIHLRGAKATTRSRTKGSSVRAVILKYNLGEVE